MQKFVNLDSNESIYFARKLEYVKSKTYDVLFPQFKMLTLIPVSTEAGPGAATITYDQYTMVGLAKIIGNYSDDLPRVDVYGKEFSTPVRTIAEAYGYNVQEIRTSAMTNKNLPTRRANAAKRANDQKVDNIALKARASNPADKGLVGLLYNANVTKGTVTTRNAHVTFATKTPAEILADLNDIVSGIIELTKGVEVPDTLLLPIAQYTKISTTPLQSGSDTTILEFFLKNNPSITSVEWVAQLKDVNPVPSTGAASSTDCMVCYRKDPDKLTLEIPSPWEQLDPQAEGLEFKVPCISRCGGVIIYYPLSVSIIEGI